MKYVKYDMQTEAIISAGLKLLREHLGFIETEIFISKVTRTGFNYTEWRENLWEDLTIDDVFERAKHAQEKYGIPDGVEVI
ncbi:MAG: hypothetical protein FWH57_04470 [Oscillospiraceae bacterium]|nr:hypothetical protein [Oscillospiraceae bacterium]